MFDSFIKSISNNINLNINYLVVSPLISCSWNRYNVTYPTHHPVLVHVMPRHVQYHMTLAGLCTAGHSWLNCGKAWLCRLSYWREEIPSCFSDSPVSPGPTAREHFNHISRKATRNYRGKWKLPIELCVSREASHESGLQGSGFYHLRWFWQVSGMCTANVGMLDVGNFVFGAQRLRGRRYVWLLAVSRHVSR